MNLSTVYTVVTTWLVASSSPLAVVSTDRNFELTLPVSKQALAQSETHVKADRVIVWVPGSYDLESDVDVDRGPVAHVKAHSAPLGLAITLTPRGNADIYAGLMVLTEKGGIRVVNNEVPALTKLRGAQKDAMTSARNTKPVVAAPKANPIGGFLEEDSDASASKPNTGVAKADREFVGAPMLRLWPAVLVTAVMAVVAMWAAKKRKGRVQINGGAIDIVAARSLGGKVRLAVVEVDGERLLLSVTDHDAALITHLSSFGLSDDDRLNQAARPRATMVPVATPVHLNRQAAPPQADCTAHEAVMPEYASSREILTDSGHPDIDVSCDVQGLLNLRHPNARKFEVAK